MNESLVFFLKGYDPMMPDPANPLMPDSFPNEMQGFPGGPPPQGPAHLGPQGFMPDEMDMFGVDSASFGQNWNGPM